MSRSPSPSSSSASASPDTIRSSPPPIIYNHSFVGYAIPDYRRRSIRRVSSAPSIHGDGSSSSSSSSPSSRPIDPLSTSPDVRSDSYVEYLRYQKTMATTSHRPSPSLHIEKRFQRVGSKFVRTHTYGVVRDDDAEGRITGVQPRYPMPADLKPFDPPNANTLATIQKRYLVRDPATNEPIETPTQMFWRIASAVAAIDEERYHVDRADCLTFARQLYDEMTSLRFMPAGRTLANAGNPFQPVVPNCVVLRIQDDMSDSDHSIYMTLAHSAILQNAGAGLGFNPSTLRPYGWSTSTAGQPASGPVSFFSNYNHSFGVIKQNGRHGANMCCMNVDHPDILEFLHCKDPIRWAEREIVMRNRRRAMMGRHLLTPDEESDIYADAREMSERLFQNFNISVVMTDRFMQLLRDAPDTPWYCVDRWSHRRPEFALPGSTDERHRIRVLGQTSDGHDLILPRRITRSHNFRDCYDVEPVEMTVAEMYEEICSCAQRNGEPGIIFIDEVNRLNPVPSLGLIEACNPCGEQMLHPGDVCNLGAINWEHYVRRPYDGRGWNDELVDGGLTFERDIRPNIDEAALTTTVRRAIRCLDNIIDLTDCPSPYIDPTRTRRLGLGPTGVADMLVRLGVRYGGPLARQVVEYVGALIQRTARDESRRLAREKTPFPEYLPSWACIDRGERPEASDFYHRYMDQPVRNAALTTAAPNGSIGIVQNVSNGIEPFFSLVYRYQGISVTQEDGSNLMVSNKHLVPALERSGVSRDAIDRIMRRILDNPHQASSLDEGGPDRPYPFDEVPRWIVRVFATAMTLTPREHVNVQASVQRHICNAASKTINLPRGSSVADVRKIYQYMWESGCKGGTVYVDGSRGEQVLIAATSRDLQDQRSSPTSSTSSSSSSKVATEEATALPPVSPPPSPPRARPTISASPSTPVSSDESGSSQDDDDDDDDDSLSCLGRLRTDVTGRQTMSPPTDRPGFRLSISGSLMCVDCN